MRLLCPDLHSLGAHARVALTRPAFARSLLGHFTEGGGDRDDLSCGKPLEENEEK